jgi:hypothetical protein
MKRQEKKTAKKVDAMIADLKAMAQSKDPVR